MSPWQKLSEYQNISFLSSVFSGVHVTRPLVLCLCFVDHCLSFCIFSFGHCVVCSFSIYGFWLPLWYLQTLHRAVKFLRLKWVRPYAGSGGLNLIGAVKSDSTHHFFGNVCTKSGPLQFSQFSGCWLILSVCLLMSFAFPFVRLLSHTCQPLKHQIRVMTLIPKWKWGS